MYNKQRQAVYVYEIKKFAKLIDKKFATYYLTATKEILYLTCIEIRAVLEFAQGCGARN